MRENRGDEIDACDLVIRQKLSQEFLKRPEIFGSKVDAVCCSFFLLNQIRQFHSPEYWCFIDSRCDGLKQADFDPWIEDFEVPLRFDKPLCDEWNETYRDMRTPFEILPQMKTKPTSDELGHRHMSAGLHTLLYACKFLDPDEIVLAGYDNVVTGGWTWSAARGPEYNEYPDHRFDIEHKMLPMISEEFNVEIRPL